MQLGTAAGAAGIMPAAVGQNAEQDSDSVKQGAQRLSMERLRAWEGYGYGMFIHFGMSTFTGEELPSGKEPPDVYAPDALDVEQWIAVARDAGMKYAVLTTKHVAGHCLWPTEYTDYNVKNSGNTTDVVEKFVEACQKYEVQPGFYYCSWDNHNRFGSQTPSDGKQEFASHTTSLYQTFQTNQITELLKRYGPILEMWVDIPGVLGRGYRTFLYNHIAELQPDIVIMMNSGIGTQEEYNVDYAWPADIIAIERRQPPEDGHKKWRTIEGKDYYMPGEVCDPIGKEWFFVEGDSPRPVGELLTQYRACRDRGANLLLDVPPDRHGVIPEKHVKALTDMGKQI